MYFLFLGISATHRESPRILRPSPSLHHDTRLQGQERMIHQKTEVEMSNCPYPKILNKYHHQQLQQT